MRSPQQHNHLAETLSSFNAEQIDLLYGLEPVYEPGKDGRLCPLTVWLEVQCPHCWSSYGSEFELGNQCEERIEDCAHCCGSIQLSFEPGDQPGQYRLGVDRAD